MDHCPGSGKFRQPASRAADGARLYSTRDLQIDINLLTSAFPTALADALDRTLAASAQIILLPEQDTSLIAAQAG